jgi:UDP-GlcNAc:undecaprenyl-phosphate/decaprenyl-phosphate GlcNAc-1-phosphate transferase
MHGIISLFPPMLSALATFAFCLFARPVCEWVGILDMPDARKQHLVATPLMGGVVLLFVVFPISLLLILFNTEPVWVPRLLIWAVALAVMALLGLADDRHTLSAPLPFACSLLDTLLLNLALERDGSLSRSLRYAVSDSSMP